MESREPASGAVTSPGFVGLGAGSGSVQGDCSRPFLPSETRARIVGKPGALTVCPLRSLNMSYSLKVSLILFNLTYFISITILTYQYLSYIYKSI